MIGLIRKIPLAKRYNFGIAFVFFSGLIMGFWAQTSSADYKSLWEKVSVLAAVHWISTAIYLWYERIWYRYFMFALSTAATYSYIDLTMRVWKQP